MDRRLSLLAALLVSLPLAAAAKGKKKHALTEAERVARSKYIADSPDAGQDVYIFDANGDPVTSGSHKKKAKHEAGASKPRHLRKFARAKLAHHKTFEDQQADATAQGQTAGLPPGVDPAAIAAAAAAAGQNQANSTGANGGE